MKQGGYASLVRIWGEKSLEIKPKMSLVSDEEQKGQDGQGSAEVPKGQEEKVS